MNTDETKDAAEPTPASAGSVAGEPVAWAVFCSGERLGVYYTERGANEVAYCSGSRAYAVPLYRQPQPPLTDAEREALERNLKHANGRWLMHVSERDQATIGGLLERTK